jgi:hypothetical protein
MEALSNFHILFINSESLSSYGQKLFISVMFEGQSLPDLEHLKVKRPALGWQ